MKYTTLLEVQLCHWRSLCVWHFWVDWFGCTTCRGFVVRLGSFICESEWSFLLISLCLRLGGCLKASIEGCWNISSSVIGCKSLISFLISSRAGLYVATRGRAADRVKASSPVPGLISSTGRLRHLQSRRGSCIALLQTPILLFLPYVALLAFSSLLPAALQRDRL